MPETFTPPASMAPEIARLIKEVQTLRNETSQLQKTTSALRSNQNELSGLQQKRSQKLSQIQALTIEWQQAINQHNNTLADMKDKQIRMLRDVELINLDNTIARERNEIQELEKKEQKLSDERQQQLVNTFHSLHTAVSNVSKQNDYFGKFVWFAYFKNNIGTKDLQPNELTSLSDRLMASQIIETFERELSESEKALTSQDKKDIADFTTLVSQIPNDKKQLDEMKRIISTEKARIQSLETELKRIQDMEGYSKEKLATFKTWGFISLAVGLISLVYGFISFKDQNTIATVMLPIGIGILILGAVLLWLRHKNDKGSREAETTQKLEGLNRQLSGHNEGFKILEEKIVKDENGLEDILRRRPVLKEMTIL